MSLMNRQASFALIIAPMAACASGLATLHLGPATARSAEINWVGGVDSSWQTAENWSAVVEGDPPMQVQRVPGEGDSVVVEDPAHGTMVQLGADTPQLANLLVSGGT